MKRNILITTPSLEYTGGVANYFKALLPVLENNEHFEFSFLFVGTGQGGDHKFHWIRDQIRFYKTLKNNRFDLIHINPSLDLKSFIRDGLFILWSRKFRRPVLVFFHGWDMRFEQVIRKVFWYFMRRTYLRADAFVVLGSVFQKKILQWGVKKKIYSETMVVDDSLIEGFSLKEKYERISNNKFLRILFLARLELNKGVIESIDAFSELINSGYKASLTICGDGVAMKAAKSRAGELGLSDKIVFTGYVKGELKKKYFAENDVFCFPTYYEGMPNCVLEAMAFGMPVITCSVGGIKDFFKDGEMGYFVKVRDSRSVALALQKLIEDKNKIFSMGKYNHSYALEYFLSSNVAKRLLAIYTQTIDRKS
ncbi:MAG: glycosyltransferase family 4 protein [Candidatus Omnitrophica bacterium]|nr:glycosyltransferase family 4 protein [Candidatus Omnitrophota bacterium]